MNELLWKHEEVEYTTKKRILVAAGCDNCKEPLPVKHSNQGTVWEKSEAENCVAIEIANFGASEVYPGLDHLKRVSAVICKKCSDKVLAALPVLKQHLDEVARKREFQR